MNDLIPFLRLALPRLPWFLGGLLLAVLTVVAATGLLALSGWFITASALAGAGLIIALDVYRPAGGIRALAVGRTVARYAERIVNHEAVLRHLADLRSWLFRALSPLDPGTLARFRSADLLQRLVGDIDTLDGLFLRVITPTLTAVLTLLGGALFFGLLAPLTVLWVVAVLALAGLILPAIAVALGGRSGEARIQAAAQVRERTVEGVQGLAELRVFGALPRQRAALAAAERDRAEAEIRLVRWGALGDTAAMLAGLGAVWLALWLGVGWLSQDLVTAPIVVLLVLATLGLSEAVAMLPGAYQRLGQIRAAAARLLEVAHTRPSLPEPAHPQRPDGEGSLTLEGIRLRYGNDAPWILDGVDLSLQPGRSVLVTGASGAGKTSLTTVALRLVAPQAGEARVCGIPVQSMGYTDLYDTVGVLGQETVLFADTVAANLRLARPEADEETLREALFLAGLDDFIAALPQGLDTAVGEGGALVSGGQARRLALARLILKDAPVVILDEPFRGLDPATIERLRQRLTPWLSRRATLVIAHEPAMAPPCTTHYRLQEGRLQEMASS
ncbi:thiol reductant ABC exporter subunit CydC [Ectothiorhodospira shaposhnikovii]|uniref:thiol reductant ABC exporter subunit CydC n=1 Tax=Ectothiorhodospira shaposhnikovii TaxID=1054 RepID=UPI00190394A2|nr:thiol reductant ABC exporter subunit CydC [Ectothiorhodospira shaposhnikovii]MBK1673014.1 thiol reductant ABC exporter subunit CydC [Ectothiorhodospira shaposhnikovii]